MGENPNVSIVGHLLSMQVNKAPVAYEIYFAHQEGMVPRSGETAEFLRRAHGNLKHRLSQCLRFGVYLWSLAKKWVET